MPSTKIIGANTARCQTNLPLSSHHPRSPRLFFTFTVQSIPAPSFWCSWSGRLILGFARLSPKLHTAPFQNCTWELSLAMDLELGTCERVTITFVVQLVLKTASSVMPFFSTLPWSRLLAGFKVWKLLALLLQSYMYSAPSAWMPKSSLPSLRALPCARQTRFCQNFLQMKPPLKGQMLGGVPYCSFSPNLHVKAQPVLWADEYHLPLSFIWHGRACHEESEWRSEKPCYLASSHWMSWGHTDVLQAPAQVRRRSKELLAYRLFTLRPSIFLAIKSNGLIAECAGCLKGEVLPFVCIAVLRQPLNYNVPSFGIRPIAAVDGSAPSFRVFPPRRSRHCQHPHAWCCPRLGWPDVMEANATWLAMAHTQVHLPPRHPFHSSVSLRSTKAQAAHWRYIILGFRGDDSTAYWPPIRIQYAISWLKCVLCRPLNTHINDKLFQVWFCSFHQNVFIPASTSCPASFVRRLYMLTATNNLHSKVISVNHHVHGRADATWPRDLSQTTWRLPNGILWSSPNPYETYSAFV